MADEEITSSLLEEYSIAEVNSENCDGSEVHMEEVGCRSLKDAFSRYAKVIFHDIADSYPTDADVQCFFSLTLGMKHKDGDIVGLFRLGWRSLSEIIISQIVPIPTRENQCDFEVQFRANDLPKDGEIYQLCYISENEVWGASVPFEFRRATVEELLVVDSGDIVIVRSQSAVVEDLKCQLATMRRDVIAAEASNAEAERRLAELGEENELLRKRLKDVEKIHQVLERSRVDNQALDEARNASEAALRESQLQIESLNSMVESLKKDMDMLQNRVSSQSQELLKYKEFSSTSQRCFSQDLIDALREGKELAVREMRAALTENDKLQQDLTYANEEKVNLLQRIDDLLKVNQTTLENQERNEKENKRRIEELLVQLTQLSSDSQQNLFEARAEKEMLQKKVAILESELQNKCETLQTSSNKIELNSLMLENVLPVHRQTVVSSVEFPVLQSHLDCIKNHYREVCLEMQEINKELECLQKTETTLIEKQSMLQSRITAIQGIINDESGCNETRQISLYENELEMTELMLKETNVCIESVCQRREELEKQQKDLHFEITSLDEQEAETNAAIAKLTVTNSNNKSCVENSETLSTKGDCELVHEDASYSCATVVLNGETSGKVADLQERLRQAADAYKTLYQEKLRVQRQLFRFKERHSQMEDLY